MKKQLLILLLLSNFNLIAQTNLIPNAGMENWDSTNTIPDNWIKYINGFWVKSSDALNGTASLQIEISSGDTFLGIYTENLVQLEAGTTYICTFYYKIVSGTFTDINFRFEDLYEINLTDFSTDIWIKGEFEYTVPVTNDDQALLVINIYGLAGATILIDNVSVFDKSLLSIIDYESHSKKIIIYPNPTNNYVYISGIKNTEEYTIVNSLGMIVLKGQINENEKIDIKDLSNGIFFLKTKTGKTFKIVKE